MERLEDRRMMAGDVIASLDAAGTLIISEAVAGEAQNVSVQQLANGNIRVAGFTTTANPGGSKILDANGNDLGFH